MMEKRKTKFKREIKSSNIKYNMDPRELHKETVKLIKVLSNLRESDTMGAAIKKTQVKKTKKKLLDLWVENIDNIPSSNMPSKDIVLSIAQSFDAKHETTYVAQLSSVFNDHGMSEHSYPSIASSDGYTDVLSENMTIFTMNTNK